MLKKMTLSLMVSVLCMQQSLAGTGSSTPLRQEQEDQPVRGGVPAPRTTQKSISPDQSDDDGAFIMAGVAALTIGSAIIYGLSQSSQEREPSRKPSGRRQDPNTFSYANENFSEEAWRKANGLPNKFPTSNSQRGHERPFYPRKNIVRESESGSNDSSSYSASSSYSQTEESSESSDMVPQTRKGCQTYKGCPLINLSGYEIPNFEATEKIDLHPVYNQNFKKRLRDEIYKHQLAYQRSETKEKKLYIITGTGQQRPGPNFRLQNAVQDLLKEDYFRRRIAYSRLEKEGLFAIFLRKNKKIMTPQGQNRKKAA
jgi:hypothetical protein